MKKIGLVGEAPNDTNAFTNLFKKQYPLLVFLPLINDIHGSQLDSPKTKQLLRKEYESLKPNFVVFIRDLDGLKNETDKLDNRKKYFTDFNSVIDKVGCYLLNIYEIEALILADIATFNTLYQCSIEYSNNPMLEPQPKEFLIKRTKSPKKYSESDNPTIFSSLNFETIKQNCAYFGEFCKKFEQLVHH
jgi:hypothetical protein